MIARWERNGRMNSIRKEEPQYGRVAWYNEEYKYHREDGPAVEYPNGRKIWYINDKIHRLDGPAIEHSYGNNYWYFQGKHINCKTQKEFERLIKLAILW